MYIMKPDTCYSNVTSDILTLSCSGLCCSISSNKDVIDLVYPLLMPLTPLQLLLSIGHIFHCAFFLYPGISYVPNIDPRQI